MLKIHHSGWEPSILCLLNFPPKALSFMLLRLSLGVRKNKSNFVVVAKFDSSNAAGLSPYVVQKSHRFPHIVERPDAPTTQLHLKEKRAAEWFSRNVQSKVTEFTTTTTTTTTATATTTTTTTRPTSVDPHGNLSPANPVIHHCRQAVSGDPGVRLQQIDKCASLSSNAPFALLWFPQNQIANNFISTPPVILLLHGV